MTTRTWTYTLTAIAALAFAMGYHGVSLVLMVISLWIEIFGRAR
jgi:hypothetical protein